MGARNAKVATEVWAKSLRRQHAAQIALSVMANTSRDRDEEPLYFAGPVPIAAALGLRGSLRTNTKRVGEAIAILREVGAVEIARKGGPGRHTRYRLVLATVPDDGGASGDERSPMTGERSSPQQSPATGERGPGAAATTVPGDRGKTVPGDRGTEEEEEEVLPAWSPRECNSSSVHDAHNSVPEEQPSRPTDTDGRDYDGLDDEEVFDPFVSDAASLPGDQSATPQPGTSPVRGLRQMHVFTPPDHRWAYLRPNGDGREWLKSHGIPAMWSIPLRAFTISPERVVDLVVMARREHWMVHEHNTHPKPPRRAG